MTQGRILSASFCATTAFRLTIRHEGAGALLRTLPLDERVSRLPATKCGTFKRKYHALPKWPRGKEWRQDCELEGGKVVSFGVLHSATPGNDYCNGNIAVIQTANDMACMCDCLHVDDVAEVLSERGLDKRPESK